MANRLQEAWGALTKSTSKSERRLMQFSNERVTWLQKQVQEFNALNAVIVDRLGCAVPPFDPYMLLALLDNNGYLMRGNRWKVSAGIGPNYKCSARLREHLKYANDKQTFRQVLKRWAFDIENFGFGYLEVQRGLYTTNFYHVPSIRTRIKPLADRTNKFIHYQYGMGMLYWQEYEEFEHGSYCGVSMFNLPSVRGNEYYGDPEWVAARAAIENNINILNVGQKYFENSLISDMSITLKGAELDPEEREKIRQYLSSTMKGVDNAHKILFFEVGPNEDVVFNTLNMKMDDSQLNIRKENKEEIVITVGVPQRLIGILQAGQLGGTGEVEGQMKIFKVGFADDRQQDYTEYIQRLLDDAGLPDAESFELLPMRIDTAAADLPELTQAAGAAIVSVDEAHNEWVMNKSMGGALAQKYPTFDHFLTDLRKMNMLLEKDLY